jgi:hypothetical protein
MNGLGTINVQSSQGDAVSERDESNSALNIVIIPEGAGIKRLSKGAGGSVIKTNTTTTQLYPAQEKRILHEAPSGKSLTSLNTKLAPSYKKDIKELMRIYQEDLSGGGRPQIISKGKKKVNPNQNLAR